MTTSLRTSLLGAACLASSIAITTFPAFAADHADSPNVGNDIAADINDGFFFLDPNDNSFVVAAFTVHGFIVPGEAVNQGIFDPNVTYRFRFDTKGDVKDDLKLDVSFSPRTAPDVAQTATVTLPNGKKFTAPATNPSLNTAAPDFVITKKEGVSFFAGEVDDPFFFDIPAFSRFIASVKAGAPDATVFNRGRDTFAGYNTMAIAVRMPVTMLKEGRPTIGMSVLTVRQKQEILADGTVARSGADFRVDRMGNPAVNVALVPFAKKNAYNAAWPTNDAAGMFAADIVGTLKFLGTDDAHIAALADIAVTNGDYLHLDVRVKNKGPKGGTNAAASFPNGRRLVDDTIDILLTVIANDAPLGDSVDASDIPPTNVFPFFAKAQQPRLPGNIDDNTRN